jgi:caa(3)-type oxidase subunit IV
MSDGHESVDIDHHVKIYMRVFAALTVLTGVTVGVSYLHVGVVVAVIIALIVALVKGSLVAGYFMHMIEENKMILWIMVLTVLFFFFALLIPMFSETHNIHMGGSHNLFTTAAAADHADEGHTAEDADEGHMAEESEGAAAEPEATDDDDAADASTDGDTEG